MKVESTLTRRGVRLEQHGCVLSEILSRPGPTHSIFDVLAASVCVAAPGPRVAMLGFAGGGMIAPLRRMGAAHAVEGVDLSGEGFQVFRRLARGWGGEVSFARGDAVAWLREQPAPFDVIIEDLSVPRDGDVIKPEVSWLELPAIMRRKLRRNGLSVFNLLPTPGLTWHQLQARCAPTGGLVIRFSQYHNRILLAGSVPASARTIGRRMRQALREIGSRVANGIEVSTFHHRG